MNKKTLIFSIFTMLLILSMPAMHSIQTSNIKENSKDSCDVCPSSNDEPKICQKLREILANAAARGSSPDATILGALINAGITIVMLLVVCAFCSL